MPISLEALYIGLLRASKSKNLVILTNGVVTLRILLSIKGRACYYKNLNIIQGANMIIYYVFGVLLMASTFLLTLDGLSRVSGLLYASSIILLVVSGGFILYCCLGILAEIQEFRSETPPKTPENIDTKINEDSP